MRGTGKAGIVGQHADTVDEAAEAIAFGDPKWVDANRDLKADNTRLRNTLDRVVLSLGGGDLDDPVELAKKVMQQIAVYEREREPCPKQ